MLTSADDITTTYLYSNTAILVALILRTEHC
jgi:hypothetical protein